MQTMTAFSITICLPIRGAAHYVCYPGTTSAAEFMRHPQIFGRCESDTPMADNGKIACLLGAVHTPRRCRLANVCHTTRPLGGSSNRLTFQVLFTGVQQVNLLPLLQKNSKYLVTDIYQVVFINIVFSSARIAVQTRAVTFGVIKSRNRVS